MDEGQSKETESRQTAEDKRKPKLSIEDQIRHLESKGVSFDLCSKEEAKAYLSEKNYFFKLAAYRKLFDKHVGGENNGRYIGLDFGHLKALATLDQQLRETVLPMTLDVEHFLKVSIIARTTDAQSEDGYQIVGDYFASLSKDRRNRLERELSIRSADEYCGDLIAKYGEHMPIWVFTEVVTFGTFVDFVRFCAERWGDKGLKRDHYLLKNVKALRNATAHSACLINGFGEGRKNHGRPPMVLSNALGSLDISKSMRTKMLGDTRMCQMASLLYLYSRIVPEGGSKSRARSRIEILANEIHEAESILPENCPAVSPMVFTRKLTRGLGLV